MSRRVVGSVAHTEAADENRWSYFSQASHRWTPSWAFHTKSVQDILILVANGKRLIHVTVPKGGSYF